MRFSEHFSITRTSKDDWFDPHLTVDTKLFVDPLLLMRNGRDSRWRGAHDQLLHHFVRCYELVAQGSSPTSMTAGQARTLLRFPEPAEFCVGYTARGTKGSGGAGGVARQLAGGIAVAIAAGLDSPKHIEELGILNKGIGADRIGDAVCNVLKSRFIRYTQAVAKRHGIPLEAHRVRNTGVDLAEARWLNDTVDLPTNPYTGGPVLLIPDRFLNDLPVLNADDWFDSDLNADVRQQMNLSIGKKASKDAIVDWARAHPDRIRAWARSVADRATITGYDFVSDPLGRVQWDAAGKTYAASHPIAGIDSIKNQDDLRALLVEMLNNFRHFIEDQRGWSLLWDTAKKKPKPEEAAQLLFLGMAQHYFRHYGVELDREVELGRGPVDFKLSKGTPIRLILEMKKAESGTFWNGLEKQLATYLTGDAVSEGWFVALQFSSTKAAQKKVADLPRRVTAAGASTGCNVRAFAIDARPKKSASKLTGADE